MRHLLGISDGSQQIQQTDVSWTAAIFVELRAGLIDSLLPKLLLSPVSR